MYANSIFPCLLLQKTIAFAALAVLNLSATPASATEAEKVIIPIAGSWYKWDKDPVAYENARAKLAELILTAKPKE